MERIMSGASVDSTNVDTVCVSGIEHTLVIERSHVHVVVYLILLWVWIEANVSLLNVGSVRAVRVV